MIGQIACQSSSLRRVNSEKVRIAKSKVRTQNCEIASQFLLLLRILSLYLTDLTFAELQVYKS